VGVRGSGVLRADGCGVPGDGRMRAVAGLERSPRNGEREPTRDDGRSGIVGSSDRESARANGFVYIYHNIYTNQGLYIFTAMHSSGGPWEREMMRSRYIYTGNDIDLFIYTSRDILSSSHTSRDVLTSSRTHIQTHTRTAMHRERWWHGGTRDDALEVCRCAFNRLESSSCIPLVTRHLVLEHVGPEAQI
jgi:hypothetical protein